MMRKQNQNHQNQIQKKHPHRVFFFLYKVIKMSTLYRERALFLETCLVFLPSILGHRRLTDVQDPAYELGVSGHALYLREC